MSTVKRSMLLNSRQSTRAVTRNSVLATDISMLDGPLMILVVGKLACCLCNHYNSPRKQEAGYWCENQGNRWLSEN